MNWAFYHDPSTVSKNILLTNSQFHYFTHSMAAVDKTIEIQHLKQLSVCPACHTVIPPLQVWTECLLCMCCVPVACIYVCSLLFTHCAAQCVYRKADMTATSINWQMLNSEVALLLCEWMLNRKLYLQWVSLSFTHWRLKAPQVFLIWICS